MSQIQKRFIKNDAVDGSKIKLSNNEALRARNAADSADIDVLKLNGSNVIVFPSAPVVGSDPLVTQTQLNDALLGLKPKEAVQIASTGNLVALSGLLEIDGYTVVAEDRVLVKDQSAPAENGIYIAKALAWVRSTDFDNVTPINEIKGASVAVMGGTLNAGKTFVCSVAPVVIDTDPISFVFFNSNSSLVAGDGIAISGSTVSAKLDGSTLTKSSSGLKVSTNGVTANEIASNAVSAAKLNADVAGIALVLNGVSNALDVNLDAAGALQVSSDALGVKVDAATVKINASNQLQAAQATSQIITLTGTDITNQYVDLAVAAISAESISLFPVGGIPQLPGLDFTVSLTGGAGSVTRISFAGDLATGGGSALVATDVLVISYSKL